MKPDLDFLCDVILHQSEVSENLEILASELKRRGCAHDRSKLQSPEFEGFVSTRGKFKSANYGTKEYKECMSLAKPAVTHHHECNRHHTAYHKNGVNDMTLIDILELLADWKAAARRSPDKKLGDTLEHAFKKYKITGQLKELMVNTLKDLKWVGEKEEDG